MRDAENRVEESRAKYGTTDGSREVAFFDPEKLDVYKLGLEFVRGADSAIAGREVSAKHSKKLDDLTTSIMQMLVALRNSLSQ